MSRKDELVVLKTRFGLCGCKIHCMTEQFGETGAEHKPRGRYSVCEVEADQHGLLTPDRDEKEPVS